MLFTATSVPQCLGFCPSETEKPHLHFSVEITAESKLAIAPQNACNGHNHLRPARLRQTLPFLLDKLLIDICDQNFRLAMPLATSLLQNLAPRTDDKTVTPARALLIVLAHLTSRDNIAQRLDSPTLQQRLPVHAPSIGVESRRVDKNVSAIALVVQSQFGESQVETDGRANFADDCVEGLQDLVARFDRVAFLHRWTVGLVHVEEMELLVALRDLALFVDPEEGVFEFLRVWVVARLVDSDGDREGVLFGGFLEAENEWRFVDGFAEFLRLFGAAGEVVGGLREEDGLDWCELYVFAVAFHLSRTLAPSATALSITKRHCFKLSSNDAVEQI